MNLWVIFLTGLSVGGLTCLAVQGGLLASVITEREKETTKNKRSHVLFSTGVFLLAKLFAYVMLGFILGAFGGALNINGQVQAFMQLFAGIYMICIALNLLDIHPIFRYVVIQPPRFLTRLVKNQSKSKDLFAPGLLGLMTIFIPCGTTLAMEALAISSASAFKGSIIMGAFIIGTMPLFFGIGIITSVLGDTFKTKFLKLAAVAVIYLGITSANGALTVLGSSVTLQTIAQDLYFTSGLTTGAGNQKNNAQTSQDVEIVITSRGYAPNYIQVKKGLPVTLTLTTRDAFSCAAAFRIPSLGIAKNMTPNETETFTFTPEEAGEIPFMCSMGMFRGVIEVI
ncbi:MAG: sulfite exporter TauE/SafE family protein [Patescibacteria group bacterium]|nr:sulfite exporter TauE/SafE family protein [Patescibacteria group bacterium]